MSLSQLLGGTRAGIATGISIGIQAVPAALVERVGRAIAEGYRKIKLKIEPGHDVDFVRAVRERVSRRRRSWPTRTTRTRCATPTRLKQLDDLDLIMIEQPLAFDDIIRHAELQRALKTPICLDESITERRQGRGHDRARARGASSTSSRGASAASRSRARSTISA